VITKQDTDQFNLRSEDQFLYDELSADEKETVDQIVDHLQEGSNLEEHPELAIYYNNLPEEYRKLVDNMAAYSSEKSAASDNPAIATSVNFGQVLENNNIVLAGTFNINNIYYDFDKAKIREDAALQLDKLVLILKGNTNIKVQMFSHTDSRGSNNYNGGLSNRRGIAAVNYLVEHGIARDRLGTKGRGESQLVNSCGNTIKCNEQAHQLNRRTEFILST
jgi:outer membrane protein OmpA-like peptidoglycan-associated protein